MTEDTTFKDGLTNVANALVQRRSGQVTNRISHIKMDEQEMREAAKTGLGNKIVSLKTGYALNDTLNFKDVSDKAIYEKHLQKHVKQAVRDMLAYGRGCIVMIEHGANLAQPRRGEVDLTKTTFKALSGDIIRGQTASMDLLSPRYMMPVAYNARGRTFHHSRVIDFTYVNPPETEAAQYFYGGISEFEMIRAQFINDGIVERASGTIVEKNSTIFHKMEGFKEQLQSGNDEDIIRYYSMLADLRSIYGDGLIDANDDVVSVAQALANLADVDQITLRRLAMVTGIPVSVLVGEAVRGLNGTGDNERAIMHDTIEALQSDFILEPLNELFAACGMQYVEFKDNQGGTPNERLDFETKAIENASKLYEMGEDHRKYLQTAGVIEVDTFDEFFAAQEAAEIEVDGNIYESEEESVDPTKALNGAQVTAILEIMARVTRGEITKDTAVRIMQTAFPVSHEEAVQLMADAIEGEARPSEQD